MCRCMRAYTDPWAADFQLAFSPQHFRSERAAWRTIIQLNLIRCVLSDSSASLSSPPVAPLNASSRSSRKNGTSRRSPCAPEPSIRVRVKRSQHRQHPVPRRRRQCASAHHHSRISIGGCGCDSRRCSPLKNSSRGSSFPRQMTGSRMYAYEQVAGGRASYRACRMWVEAEMARAGSLGDRAQRKVRRTTRQQSLPRVGTTLLRCGMTPS